MITAGMDPLGLLTGSNLLPSAASSEECAAAAAGPWNLQEMEKGEVFGWTLLYVLLLSLCCCVAVFAAIRLVIKVPSLRGLLSTGQMSSSRVWGISVPLFLVFCLDSFSLSTIMSSKSLGWGYACGSTAFALWVGPLIDARRSGAAKSAWFGLEEFALVVVGLVLLSLSLAVGAQDWVASKEKRASACWPGQESLCCYLNPRPELGKRQSGVLLWWESLVVIGVFLVCKFGMDLYASKYYSASHASSGTNMSTGSGAKVFAVNSSTNVDRLAAAIVVCAPSCEKAFSALTNNNPGALELGEGDVVRAARFYARVCGASNGNNKNFDSASVGSELFAKMLKFSKAGKTATSAGQEGIDLAMFNKWYISVEVELIQEASAIYDALYKDIKGLGAALQLLGCKPSARSVLSARRCLGFDRTEPSNQSAFLRWYKASNLEFAGAIYNGAFYSNRYEENGSEINENLLVEIASKMISRFSILWIIGACVGIVYSLNQLGVLLSVPGSVLGAFLPFILDGPVVLFHPDHQKAYRISNPSLGLASLNLCIVLPCAWLFVATISQRPVIVPDSNAFGGTITLAWFAAMSLLANQIYSWRIDRMSAALSVALYFFWLLQHLLTADWTRQTPALVICGGCDSEFLLVD